MSALLSLSAAKNMCKRVYMYFAFPYVAVVVSLEARSYYISSRVYELYQNVKAEHSEKKGKW